MPPLQPQHRRRAVLAAAAAAVVLLAVAATPQWGCGWRAAEAATYPAESWAAADDYGCTVGECVDAGGAAARRELGGSGYIGYGAMGAGNTPCSYRGASYYNCQPGGSGNPYTRGCSAITQCRG